MFLSFLFQETPRKGDKKIYKEEEKKEKEQKEGVREKQAVSQSSREIPIALAMYTYIKMRSPSSG